MRRLVLRFAGFAEEYASACPRTISVVREGGKVGLPFSANAVLTDLVKRVERDELKPDPRLITELRLN
jgi:hypothetical protein